MNLTKEADLAAQWDVSLEQMRVLRRRHGWACVRFSRQDIRYTDDQIEQIVRDLTVLPRPNELPRIAGGLPGQTARSAARNR